MESWTLGKNIIHVSFLNLMLERVPEFLRDVVHTITVLEREVEHVIGGHSVPAGGGLPPRADGGAAPAGAGAHHVHGEVATQLPTVLQSLVGRVAVTDEPSRPDLPATHPVPACRPRTLLSSGLPPAVRGGQGGVPPVGGAPGCPGWQRRLGDRALQLVCQPRLR